MNKEPLVSIIIINYNGKSYLEECLQSLKKITYNNFEIILVDNNSTDNSVEFVKNHYPSIMIIKLDKNYGFAYPNNVGVKNARGELLLFLNNDTSVDPQFVTELVDAINSDSKIAICQSMLLKPNGEVDSSGDFIDHIGIAYSSKKKIENVREILSAKGASMLVRKEIYNKLGGFDEKFFISFEDVDLGWRSWILGYKVVVIPKSIVFHKGGKTVKTLKSNVAFHGLKNQISMKFTNFESKSTLKIIFSFFLKYGLQELRVWLDYKLKGTTKIKATDYEEKITCKPNVQEILKSFLWIVNNLSYLRKKQKQVNSSRILSTKTLKEMGLISNIVK